jgi:hypothetical protein
VDTFTTSEIIVIAIAFVGLSVTMSVKNPSLSKRGEAYANIIDRLLGKKKSKESEEKIEKKGKKKG